MLDLAETLKYVDITNKEDFYNTLKCSLLAKHEQEALFNQMFLYYWYMRDRQNNKGENPRGAAKRDERQMRLPPSERKRLAEHLNANEQQRKDLRSEMRQSERPRRAHERIDEEDDDDNAQPQGTAYSAIEMLRKKDFESFTWEEVQEAKKLMAEMRWHLGQRPTHRKAPSRKGSYPDMRRIVRRNLKYGAEILELTWRETKQKPRPLVIICDISGSMSLYSRLLLHFIHTISNGLMNVEAFVFGTRLTRITRQLKKRDVDDAVRDVSRSVQDWSGGTRIGDALHYFNHYWARRVLGRGAVVLVISDGWDRGEAGVLEVEMDRLQHSCHRLIWLNPLLGSPDYRPLTIGMRTALPYIDNFLPAHNLDSLINLGNLLATIDDSRPERSAAKRRKAVAAWTKTGKQ
ncbi:MAG: VWA domain-containing protein [Chloroflexi bacterium]|nr:MAG: VWA domain-containing protein [Chloroflexota bacterium]TMC35324.1 MAG: VWA domain-containing protein [Chloroflexota bacterium]TMC94489.1 MAG: VWA domain-containing protein [Chloroflexota bacterium]TMD80127.1 MAG: VWA domain-containing protein [Chloroflexota bacterium]